MFPTKNDIDVKVREKVITILQASLADSIDLQTQTKQAHWNVKGPNFIGLHKLFDEIYDEVGDYADLLAERAVQLGAAVQGTARVAAKYSRLSEYPLDISAGPDHVEALASALAAYGKLARAAIDTTANLGDAGTSDTFTEISRGIDKWVWFVEAHLQAEK